jgi:hypothetical protein
MDKKSDIELMDEILHRHFNSYRQSIGLEPESMSEKAKEYFRMALEEYAEYYYLTKK